MASRLNTTSKSKKSKSDTAATGIVSSKLLESIKGTPSSRAQNVSNGVDRQEMIAMAAYYRAEKRGFNNGDAIQDWLEAEAEIDGLI